MAHTPGPWYAWERNQAQGWITDTSERSDDVLPFETNIIARVLRLGHWPTTDANARLIAAAPDLLAAAQMALELDHISEVSHAVIQQVGPDVFNKLRAAVAKAKGS